MPVNIQMISSVGYMPHPHHYMLAQIYPNQL